MRKIYYIGGSPCSGKSTIAEMLAEKYGFVYFKVDELLDKYIALAADKGYEVCKKVKQMTPEQTWMRDAHIQCEEEFAIYREIFEFIQKDLELIDTKKGVITEGAAYLPELISRNQITDNRYLAITPTKEFQVEHYGKREWVPYVLEGCLDKEAAFKNWMDRDVLFADEVRQGAEKLGYQSLVTDGSVGVEEMYERVCRQFGID